MKTDPARISTPCTAWTRGSPNHVLADWKNTRNRLDFEAFLALAAGLDLGFVFALDLNMVGRTLKQ